MGSVWIKKDGAEKMSSKNIGTVRQCQLWLENVYLYVISHHKAHLNWPVHCMYTN